MAGRAELTGAVGETLHSARVETTLGRFHYVRSGRGLCLLSLAPGPGELPLRSYCRRHAPGARIVEEAPQGPVAEQLVEYALGNLRDFELTLDLRGTTFQRSVWDELLQIPFGGTRTYGEVAARLGQPGASRAVGAASGANPVPLVVPCHRVVARGGLGGFSGGPGLKERLLAHECVLLPG